MLLELLVINLGRADGALCDITNSQIWKDLLKGIELYCFCYVN